MSSHLNDVALIEDKYRIGASYGRQPVCDDERGATAGEAAQRFHNSPFRAGIQQYLAAYWVVETRNKTHQCGLACASRADESDSLAGFGAERDAPQHHIARTVIEANRAKFQFPSAGVWHHGVRRFADFRFFREHIAKTLRGHRGLSHDTAHLGELTDWVGHAPKVGKKNEELAGRDPSCKDLRSAVPHDRPGCHGHHEAHQRCKLQQELAGLEGCAETLFGLFGEAIILVGFAAVGLNDVNVGNDLLSFAPQFTFLSARATEGKP